MPSNDDSDVAGVSGVTRSDVTGRDVTERKASSVSVVILSKLSQRDKLSGAWNKSMGGTLMRVVEAADETADTTGELGSCLFSASLSTMN